MSADENRTTQRSWHIVAVMNGWRVWCSDGTPGDPAHNNILDARRELAERNAMEHAVLPAARGSDDGAGQSAGCGWNR